MQFTNEKEVNPSYIVGWEDIPQVFTDELTQMLREMSENPDVKFELGTVKYGAMLEVGEEFADEVISWEELEGYGLLFAFNYHLKARGISVLGANGVYLSKDPIEYPPQEKDIAIQNLRLWGYQIKGLTA